MPNVPVLVEGEQPQVEGKYQPWSLEMRTLRVWHGGLAEHTVAATPVFHRLEEVDGRSGSYRVLEEGMLRTGGTLESPQAPLMGLQEDRSQIS